MTETITPELSDYRARCFVNGAARHDATGNWEPITGQFHERFLSHPWVRESISEGWDRELRMHLIHTAKIAIMRKMPLPSVENLMPDKRWVEAAKIDADRYRKAAEWRKANRPETMSAIGMLKRFGIGIQS